MTLSKEEAAACLAQFAKIERIAQYLQEQRFAALQSPDLSFASSQWEPLNEANRILEEAAAQVARDYNLQRSEKSEKRRARIKMAKLKAENVDTVMRDCLFRDSEIVDGKPPSDAVIVDGIVRKFGLHKQRLESHRSEVAEMLAELPDEFMAEKGGGWSFLNACNDRHGVQWGEHINIEALLVLGIGLGLAEIQLPREMWSVLPGGMPYFSVKLKQVA